MRLRMFGMKSLWHTALGYGNTEAVRAVRAVSGADEMDSETLLKQALKKIMIF